MTYSTVIPSVVEKSRFLFGILRLRATRSAQNDILYCHFEHTPLSFRAQSRNLAFFLGFFDKLRMTCYTGFFDFALRAPLRMTCYSVISSAVEKSRLYAPVMLIFIRTELASIVSLQSISQPSIQTRSVCFTLVFCAKLLTLRLHTILSDSNGCVS